MAPGLAMLVRTMSVKTDFPRNAILKGGGRGILFPCNVFWLKKYKKYEIIINYNLRSWHFLLNHRQVIRIVISSVQQYICLCKRPWRWLEHEHWNLERQRPLILIQNFITTSKQASIFTNSFLVVAAQCLFESIYSNTLMPASKCLSPSVNVVPSWFSP